MNGKNLSRLMVLFISLLIACTAKAPPGAQTALSDFLGDLYNGRYAEAIQLYGGSYETMIDHNPEIDPDNHVALIENACKINGAQCLEVKSITLESEISASEFQFTVEFLNADGTLFVQGPCCSGNETDTPPISTFIFTILKTGEDKFLVMDMPPYTP